MNSVCYLLAKRSVSLLSLFPLLPTYPHDFVHMLVFMADIGIYFYISTKDRKITCQTHSIQNVSVASP